MLFSSKGAESAHIQVRKNMFGSLPQTHTRINCVEIADTHVESKTMKTAEENGRNILVTVE